MFLIISLISPTSVATIGQLQAIAAKLGADKLLQSQISKANTSIQALQLCQQANIDLAGAVCLAAQQQAQKIVPHSVNVEIIAVDRQGQLIGQAI